MEWPLLRAEVDEASHAVIWGTPDPRIPVGKIGPMSEIPDLAVVRHVFDCLDAHGLVGALGGSGLLAGLGLTQVVHDWDITTDTAVEDVEAALADTGLPYESKSAGDGMFASTARFIVNAASHEIDVIVGFALRDKGLTIELPTHVTGSWQGLPLGDPSIWETAYRIMGKTSKADLIASWQEGIASSL